VVTEPGRELVVLVLAAVLEAVAVEVLEAVAVAVAVAAGHHLGMSRTMTPECSLR
jgi:hypothetical protein